MAAVITIRTLYYCLVFSVGTATAITDDIGIDILDKLKLLHDNDCEIICKYIHRPGGTIFGQGGVDIPNRGIPVTLWDAMNLTLTTYYFLHMDKISKTIVAANLALPVVRLICSLKERQ